MKVIVVHSGDAWMEGEADVLCVCTEEVARKCYVFLFINSGLKLLYRKIIKELKKWTFRDAVRSWGFEKLDEDEMLTEKEKELGMTDYWRPHFSWGFLLLNFLFHHLCFSITFS